MAEDRKQLPQVATGHLRKQTAVGKAAKAFFSEDAGTVASVAWHEWIVPFLKRSAVNAFDMLLNGGNATRGGYYAKNEPTPYYRYSASSNSYNSGTTRMAPSRGRFQYMDYDFDNLEDVLRVIDELTDLLRQYPNVRVTDVNTAIGITGTYIDQNWGWTDARDFRWDRRYGKYYLNFAQPIPLDR